MTSSRRRFILACAATALPFGHEASGGSARRLFSTDNGNLAIRGYDTVAYFTDGKPVRGSPEFEFEWQGARWRFASAAHRDQFSKQPEYFAPRFGGFCAGAIADGIFVTPDPEAWAIVDGKLYLNGSKEGLVDWQRDPFANIAKAQGRWEALGQ